MISVFLDFLGFFLQHGKTIFCYVIIHFLTKVEPNYANDAHDSKPELREDVEEKQSRVQRKSYSSEKDKGDSYDGKVQQ